LLVSRFFDTTRVTPVKSNEFISNPAGSTIGIYTSLTS
jgi:hypothetical protein